MPPFPRRFLRAILVQKAGGGMTGMAYRIKIIDDLSEMGKGNTAEINIYNWGGGYRPVSKAVLCFVRGKGFAVRLTSEETSPRATQTEPDSRVWEDSCLEFFANFQPQMPGSGYLNFECNALGAMLCCYGGPSGPGARRVPVVELGCPHPRPRVIRTADTWGWELLVPLSMLRTVYGAAEFHSGDEIRGSFYKCGDLTERPHYGSYTKIDWPTPDFHRPESFAEMILAD